MFCCKAEEFKWCKDLETVYTDEEGGKYCIFHAPKEYKKITVEEFNDLIFERIQTAINEQTRCDLSGTIFPGDIKFRQFDKKNPFPIISFGYATFTGGANFAATKFSRMVSFHNTTFSGDADFSYTDFSEMPDLEFATFNCTDFRKKADFSGAEFRMILFRFAKFSGKANFASAKFNSLTSFSDSEFSGVANFMYAKFIKNKVEFTGTKFIEKASFEGTNFSNLTSFENAKFSELAYFKYAKFNKEASFISTNFNGITDFTDSKFIETADFKGSKFRRKSEFKRAEFSRGAGFNSVEFKGKVSFEDVKFSGTASFYNAKFSGEADFTITKFSRMVSFKHAKFSRITVFTETEFSREAWFVLCSVNEMIRFIMVNLSYVSFIGTDLRKFKFIDCKWPEKKTIPKRRLLFDEIRIHPLEEYRTGSKTFDAVEDLYRKLKQKYKEEHNEPEVSHWHYAEKEIFRKKKWWRRFNPISFSNLYWISSGYGERPVRSGIMLVLLLTGITILINFFGLIPSSGGSVYGISSIKGFSGTFDWKKFWLLIYNTIQYALFAKEPYFRPESLAGDILLTAFTKLFIPLQSALFAFALRNKFRR